jgi:hypothetical protein
VRGIEADGSEHRQHLREEVALDPARLLLRPVAALEQADALALERRQQHVVEHAVLLGHQRVRALADAPQRLGGRHGVRLVARDAEGELLAQARDANLEELVEVRAADRQEAQALEQRRRRVLRLLEHTRVELELRQLAVEAAAPTRGGRGAGTAVVVSGTATAVGSSCAGSSAV